jgi:hypothetical protein
VIISDTFLAFSLADFGLPRLLVMLFWMCHNLSLHYLIYVNVSLTSNYTHVKYNKDWFSHMSVKQVPCRRSLIQSASDRLSWRHYPDFDNETLRLAAPSIR